MMTVKILVASGQAIYGENWIAPLANALQINSSDIERYINREGPCIGKVDALSDLLVQKEAEVHQALIKLNEAYRANDARIKAIKAFKKGDASQLTAESKVYCRLRFNIKGFYKADVQIQEPKEKTGWQVHEFDNKYFMRDVVNLDEVLAEKMQVHMALVDVDLVDEENPSQVYSV